MDVRLEIGPNLKDAIDKMVDKHAEEGTMDLLGANIKAAFGIDLTRSVVEKCREGITKSLTERVIRKNAP